LASWLLRHWESRLEAPTRAGRRGGAFRPYLPDPLNGRPLDAQFVPPPPEHVATLMEDLVSYAGGGVHAPLVQAALVHAQFETIHPYTDGNGRVGRA
jgi:Fic family protein